MADKEIKKLIQEECNRQRSVINLIASENYVSRDVLEALGSVFVNKYAEGYPQARYYAGNKWVDELENLTRQRALNLFGVYGSDWSVNVQPYSGSPANLAVYHALVPKGGKIMGMALSMGGHLTHGYKVSVTGKLWEQVPYGVDKETEQLDYKEIKELAKKEKPNLIVAGYTAYSRKIDFGKFREIADETGAFLMVDMSHIAGLVAAESHPSPFPYADVVTTTTHKTLRGPRSALIFSKGELSKKIDKAVFPGLQGGPHMNQIAAAAVALKEANTPEFKEYANQVVVNARTLSESLKNLGWRIVSGGTDTHLILLDTWEKKISGGEAEKKLEEAGIIVNKNTIPFDERKPVDPSGIRLGTPAVTTRGMKEKEMKKISEIINCVLKGGVGNNDVKIDMKVEIADLCEKFPLSYE
jgi:glycine hydroxymethyltransferase